MIGQTPAFHEGIKLVSYCPLCETQYNVRKAKVLEEHEDAQLIHIKCTKCKASVVAVIVMNQMGVSSVGLVSDLTSDEVAKFGNMHTISADEVLAIHNELQNKNLENIFHFKK